MVCLDGLRRPSHTARFDDVRIERSLYQPLDLPGLTLQAMSFRVKNLDERVTDDLALLFGISDTPKLGEKLLAGVHGHQIQSKLVTHALLDFFELVLTKYSALNEDAGQPVAYRFVDQRGGHGRIHSAGEATDRSAVFANALANLADRLIDEVLRRPVSSRPTDVVNKIAKQIDAQLRMVDLRMELYGPNFLRLVLHCRQSVAGTRYNTETGRQRLCLITVRHPNVHR